MTRMGSIRVAVLLVLCVVAPSLAQSPATQPEGRLTPYVYKNLSDDEKTQLETWINNRMPNLAKLIRNSSENKGGGFRRNRLLNAAAIRYRNFQQAKDEPGVYELLMKNVRLEDEIFGLIGQLDTVPSDQRVKLIDQIRSKTRAMIDQFLADRAERIKKLRDRLDTEQRSLDADRKQTEAIVNQRLAHFFVIDPAATAPSAEASDSVSTTEPSQ